MEEDKTPIDLMREHYPEAMKELNRFKEEFGAVQLNHIKCSITETGTPLTGNAINPYVRCEVLPISELRKLK